MVLRVAILVFLVLIHCFILLWIRGIKLDVVSVIRVLMGGLFVVVAIFMSRIQPNWFVGTRTP